MQNVVEAQSIASLFLVVAVIVTWIRTKRKGDEWFRTGENV